MRSTEDEPIATARLCIVTVVRNGAGTLGASLASVRRLDLRPLTHLIVDGMSTDQTPALVATHASLAREVGIEIVALQQRPSGVYAAMNLAVEYAPPDSVIFFLNADDRALADGPWREVVRAFETPEVAFVYTGARFVKPDGRVEERPPRSLRASGWLDHQSLFARCSLLTAHPFDTRYGLAADSVWASKVLTRVEGAYFLRPVAEVSLGGLSYAQPWAVLRGYSRFLWEQGRYTDVARETVRTCVGAVKRRLRSIIIRGD